MPSNEKNRASLRGVSILAVTPLDREARLCEADLRSLLEFVAAPSVEGESIGGVTDGRGVLPLARGQVPGGPDLQGVFAPPYEPLSPEDQEKVREQLSRLLESNERVQRR